MTKALLILGLFTAVLLLSFVIRGVTYSSSRHSTSVLINAPAQRVFQYLIDPEKLKLWIEGFVSSEALGDGRLEVGARSIETIRDGSRLLRMETEIRELVFDQKLGVALSMPDTFTGEAAYTLVPTGTMTMLDLDYRARFEPFFMKALSPLIHLKSQQMLEGNFARLKKAVESEPGE